ncbi:glycosyltransferase, partial [Candidatus Parcubacteria bacterium]|nr:glycosyltransferase [Candidatus Parcubacteria bacterium]
RAWKKYDVNIENWNNTSAKKRLDKIYQPKYMRDYMSNIFDKVYSGQIITWDFQWFYACLINNGLCIVPCVNLISNIGITGTNANFTSYGKNQNLPTFNIYNNPPLKHPTSIYQNTNYDYTFYKINFKQSLFKKLKLKIISIPQKPRIPLIINRLLMRVKSKILGQVLLKNVNKTSFSKNALLMYITEPFKNINNDYTHQNRKQVRQIALALKEFNYNVDVMNYNDNKIKLQHNYDLILDLHPGLNPIYEKHLNPKAKKIAYLTGSNPIFCVNSENERLKDIYQKRNIKLEPKIKVKPFNKEYLKSFNAIFLMGNEQTLKTYDDYTPSKVSLINNTGYNFLNTDDFSKKSPKNFLFLNSSGQVLKGLDLLLEVFSKNKELNLYVCSNFANEKDFCELYKKELFETPNIHPVGFIDINSFKFMEIASKCSYIISPSCSEGMSGSILTGMSAGLIPITSKENGIDSSDVFMLQDIKINTISNAINNFSGMNMKWITEQSKKAMRIAKEKYSNKNFYNSIKLALKETLSEK